MSKFNEEYFDNIINRRKPGDEKYTSLNDPEDVIPLWVADMDFKIAPAIEEALIEVAKYGIFGYTEPAADYDEAVINWLKNRLDYEIKSEWLLKLPSVMFAVAQSIRAFSKEGEAVLINQPVYHPFEKIISANRRKPVISELINNNGHYEMNFSDMEKQITENNVKLFLFCSPHNPVGRVWKREELEAIAEICLKRGVKIISDEIHADFIFPGYKHIPTATISDEVAMNVITLTAPTKSFNIAGTQAANVIVKNDSLRNTLKKEFLSTGLYSIGLPSIVAVKAAYNESADWFDALLKYLDGNVSLVKDFCDKTNGKITFEKPEGTYLLWLDCRNMKMSNAELDSFFLNKAKLRLNSGYTFGKGGDGFMRMNVASPRPILSKALAQLKDALNDL